MKESDVPHVIEHPYTKSLHEVIGNVIKIKHDLAEQIEFLELIESGFKPYEVEIFYPGGTNKKTHPPGTRKRIYWTDNLTKLKKVISYSTMMKTTITKLPFER